MPSPKWWHLQVSGKNRVFRDNLFRLLSNAIEFKGTGQDDVIVPATDAEVDGVTDC